MIEDLVTAERRWSYSLGIYKHLLSPHHLNTFLCLLHHRNTHYWKRRCSWKFVIEPHCIRPLKCSNEQMAQTSLGAKSRTFLSSPHHQHWGSPALLLAGLRHLTGLEDGDSSSPNVQALQTAADRRSRRAAVRNLGKEKGC